MEKNPDIANPNFKDKQGGQFLKKLWCCLGGDVKHKIMDLSTELIGRLATVKRLTADVSSVSPSSERIKELWVALRFGEWWSYASGRNMAT